MMYTLALSIHTYKKDSLAVKSEVNQKGIATGK